MTQYIKRTLFDKPANKVDRLGLVTKTFKSDEIDLRMVRNCRKGLRPPDG